jgi:hypothetical protein
MAESIISKHCELCQRTKPLSEFYARRDRKSPSGTYRFCKSCVSNESKAIYRLKKGRDIKPVWRNVTFNFLIPYKRCSKCSTFKGGEKFCSNSRNKDGLSDWCRDCHRERNNRPDLVAKRKGKSGTSKVPKKRGRISGRGTPQRVECKQCGVIIWRRPDYKKFKGFCTSCLYPASPLSATAIRKKEYGSSHYRKWRKTVLIRDGICQICGSMKNLEVDHIMPYSTHPELRFEVSNGRTLCRPCHQATDTYGSGAKKYKKSV